MAFSGIVLGAFMRPFEYICSSMPELSPRLRLALCYPGPWCSAHCLFLRC